MSTPPRLSTDTVPPFRTPGVRWQTSSFSNEFVKKIQDELSINSTIAHLVAKLGFNRIEEVQKFLFPKLSDLAAPEEVTNIPQAVERLTESLYRKEKIVISPEDITTVTQQIKTVWQKIQDRAFYTGCGKPECRWCNFVKTNEMAIALHDLSDEEPE